PALADIAGTLALRRSQLDHCAVAVADSCRDACARLRSFVAGQACPGLVSGRRGREPKIAFVFTGQGAHWWAMGRDLLENDPVVRGVIEQCDQIFSKFSGWSIIDELMASEEASRLDRTIVAQPATFALQMGLAERWKRWGIEPAAVIGHSIGEMAA